MTGITTVMSDFAECPVWDPNSANMDYDKPYDGRDFYTVMTDVLDDENPFNIATTADRWA